MKNHITPSFAARILTFYTLSALIGLQCTQKVFSQELPAQAGGAAHPQVIFGTIAGIVRNPARLPIAGATVTAIRLDGGSIRTTISGSDGIYSFADVLPGTYSVMTQAEGHIEATVASLQVTSGRPTRTDIAMTPILTVPPAQTIISSTATRPDPNSAPSGRPSQSIWKRWAKGDTIRWGDMTPQKPSAAGASNSSAVVASLKAPLAPAPQPAASPAAPVFPDALAASPADPEAPFAWGDFTWLNGTARTKDSVLDTKFFTPEIRFDTHFITDFNQPRDHSMGGSTEQFRSGEVQIEQASIGGDFHWQNVRGRILLMDGMFAATTPRNDASSGVGQWDVRTAYRYVSEAYGGYHFDVNHGLNIDAGIFVSYIGLFSYYNFDNWTYQPSFVSSNTPWFFNGVRIQWFPTKKLKIEPWIINGWQSYNRFNGHHGFGGQILYRPTEWLSLVSNNYGNGTDTLGNPNRVRLHTDNSIEVRYYNHPESTGISKMAFSATGDLGCEYGGGVTCHGGKGGPKQSFLGWMIYDRTWWGKDKYAITLGGGRMNNAGRYLTLLPPINGADAVSGSPYFTANPGDKAHMWDATANFQWMPRQYITWWAEAGYRHSDVPYWSGRGGITPPGGNTGSPSQFVCAAGGSAGTSDLATAYTNCGGPGSVWFPDLRKGQATISAGVLVKF